MSIFALLLITCITAGISIICALIIGYFLFFIYGLTRKHTIRDLLNMTIIGMKTVKNIMLVFLLIGLMTSLWRASGTIPIIICYASRIFRPSLFLLDTFLLNCLVSLLIGTSFGTAATVGIICMTIGKTIGIESALIGGAILAGAFFGDRCSPMSTSAHLTRELTSTDIYKNINGMMRTGLIPFLISCAIYLILGLKYKYSGLSDESLLLLEHSFSMNWMLFIPAGLILVLSLLRFNIKHVMLISIISSAVLCAIIQKMQIAEILRAMIFGWKSDNVQLNSILGGGGLLSMIKVAFIVLISSSYSGIFEGTGLLDGLKNIIKNISKKSTPYLAVFFAACILSIVSCNQTLAIMLTYQTCKDVRDNNYDFALDIENSAVITAPLVPWSIASAVPLSVICAPTSSILYAYFLYLLLISEILRAIIEKKKRGIQ